MPHTLRPTAQSAPREGRKQATVPRLTVTSSDTSRFLLLLAGTVAFGALLRLPGLINFPLEQDELYTVIESTDLFRTTLLPGISARPLYFLFQHLLFDLGVGTTTVAIRMAPLILGLLGIWVTGMLALRAAGRAAGLTAAFLVAISPWHLHISGLARYWSLLYFLSAAACYYLHRGYQEDRTRDYILAFVFLALGTATHPTFVFPMIGVALAVTLVGKKGSLGWHWPTRRAWGFLWGPYALFVVAAVGALKLAGRESAVQNWSGRGLLASIRLVPAIVEWLTPTVVVAGLAGAIALMVVGTAGQKLWGGMALVGVFSAVVLLGLASFSTDVYADYATSMLPLVFMAAGSLVQLGIDRLPGAPTLAGVASVAVLSAGVMPGTASYLSDGTRFDYRPAFAHIERTAPETLVVAWPLVVQRHYAPALRSVPLHANVAYLDSLLVAETDLWIPASVRRFGIVSDDQGSVADWLQRHCVLTTSHERLRFDVRMYRVDLYRCNANRGQAAAS